MESDPFVILVSDRDATVGVVASMLLSAALASIHVAFLLKVRVLVDPEVISVVETPELPEQIRRIEEIAISARPADVANAQLIVSFSGVDVEKLNELRSSGIAVPAVNLCQFVDKFEGIASQSIPEHVHTQDVIVESALKFGFSGGSSTCEICEEKASQLFDYWVNIADTCTRFAQSVQRLQPK